MRLRSLTATVLALAGFLQAARSSPTVPRKTASVQALKGRVEAAIRAFPGVMGVAVRNLDTGETFAVTGDLRFPTASLIKVAVMVEVEHQVAEGKIFRPTFRDGHADVFPEEEKEFGLGVTTPNEIAKLMELIAEGKVVSRAA